MPGSEDFGNSPAIGAAGDPVPSRPVLSRPVPIWVPYYTEVARGRPGALLVGGPMENVGEATHLSSRE